MSPKRENKDIYLIAVLNVVSGAVLWPQSNLRAISEHKSQIAPIAIEAFA